jgi:cytochrome c biogenesis protein
MRFAISLLTLICIASVIGTVVKQRAAATTTSTSSGRSGPRCSARSGCTRSTARWFLLILAFLVISTSLCIARNTPKILATARATRRAVREQALRPSTTRPRPLAVDGRRRRWRGVNGCWQGRLEGAREVRGHGTMVAARKGMANKIGYLAAHSAIVLICLGGLFDGDLVVRAQMALQGKTPFTAAA